MTAKPKENLSWIIDAASKKIIWETKKSISLLEKETRIQFFKKASDWIKKLFWNLLKEANHSYKNKITQKEKDLQWWNTISERMFQELLQIEGNQNFIATIHKKNFWETFVTWPYGMVSKHIDSKWNLLNKPVSFKNWERVSKEWAEKNARDYYNKKAKEWSDLLKSKWYKYSQDMLDALVCASWWTKKSQKRLKEYVISHWGDEDAIYNFMSKFAITAAWNWEVMSGLIRRRKFEANRFKWNKQPYETYRA